MSLRHIVSWKLSGETREERDAQAAQAIPAIEALRDLIPTVRSLTVHRNELHDGTNFDLTLVSEFDDAEGLAVYATHPEHLPVIDLVKGMTVARAATDFTV
ncbi:Dabb family protein [Leucobacter japonicus]|uniref:Dabb family protein n=1 Tax=Leucobacter japonicus TaxID=1461259 RepID=UPI0006A7BEA5|nr:Dabb family protein [Leucobacter japonicus]